MWQDRQAGLLTNEIEAILSSLANEASFYHLVKESLTQAKRGLAAKTIGDKPWPLLPLIVCEAVSGEYEHAIPAAAALELFKSAAEVLDDTEDADSPESIPARYGTAVATNIATVLLILAEKAITRLEGRGVESSLIIHVMDVVNSLCTIACAGQHLDLSPTLEIAVSEDAYLRIADMKSASTVQCACYVGALLATSNQELIDTFVIFGHNLGMASQIANDIQGVTRGSDILKRKITLPVIYALSLADGKARHQLELTFSKKTKSTPNLSQTRDLLFRTGAIHYATIKMELYKQQALDILSRAEVAGANAEQLKLFLE
jgi:geranylgeranyl pyrophosphate synthase